MNKNEKLTEVLTYLSEQWDMSVTDVADRLNKMSEDEIKNAVKMAKLFEKGGKLHYLLCMKNGGVADCGCGKKIEKAQGGSEGVGQHDYYRPSRLESTLRVFSRNPQYRREDGMGTYSGEILPSGDTLTVVHGPYTKFEETRTTDGGRYFDVSGDEYIDRTYAPNSSSRGWSRKPADPEIVEMFDNIRKRFK